MDEKKESIAENARNEKIKKIITKDSSVTYFNEEFQEYYHSLAGAREEAREKYAKPAIEYLSEKGKIAPDKKDEENERGDNRKIRILDFCFGLGYNSYIFIEELRNINKDIELEIIGLEIDMEIIAISKELFKEFIRKNIYDDKKISLKIEIGDAEKEIENLEGEFDGCFFDPFSPKKCPNLWTKEIFKKVYSLMSKESILITYSCAKEVRDNMKEAGFIVKDGPIIGRWCPATIAIKEQTKE